MTLENMDFQSVVHQHVSTMLDRWRAEGFSEEQIQDTASRTFNMGLIAGQQVQQEGAITPQGTEQSIPYTEAMAERVVVQFLEGLNISILKANEMRLPPTETWDLMQNVAYHVYEQSKQAVVATLGQENTPEVQISDDQIYNWLGQTAVEALIYYITEHEKQHGPIARLDEEIMPDLLNQPEMPQDMPVEQPLVADAGVPMEQPVQQPVHQAVPEIHHKYAAVGLLVSSLSANRGSKILSAFSPEEQQIINQYRDPEVVARNLDLGTVARYLKQFKEKMGQDRDGSKSKYASTVSKVLEELPPNRLNQLFQKERPLVRGYIQQYTKNKGERDYEPYELPSGVEESLVLYLHRNFPEEISVS